MKKNDPFLALRYPEFNLLLIARFALVFATTMQFIIIEWEVYRLTKDPLYLGIIGLMEVIPVILVSLVAGHVVDQKEKRTLLLKCISVFIAVSLGLFFITRPEIIEHSSKNFILYSVYGLVFFGGIVRAFLTPSAFVLTTLVVPKNVYPNATTWSSSSWQIGSVLGPAIAGFSISFFGVHWSMCVVLAFAVLSWICISKIQRKPILNSKIGEPIFDSLKEGWKFVFNNKVIFGALSLDMVAVLFGGAMALLPVYAQDILKVGPEGFGFLRAAPAVGAFITMIIIAYTPLIKHVGIKLLASIFGFGICIIIFGVSEIFWISLLAMFFLGVFDGVSIVIRQTILQLQTPDHMRGRVSAVNSIFVGSSNELGAFESGLTAKLMGTVTAVVFGGSMTILFVLSTGIFSKTFRKLDFTKDIDSNVVD